MGENIPKKKIIVLLVVIAAVSILLFLFFAIRAKINQTKAAEIKKVTQEMILIMEQFRSEGYLGCQDFFDDGNNLPSAPYNYYQNGVMRQYFGKFYWLRCNFTANKPVVIRLRNKRLPDQFIPPIPDWGYIYEDNAAQNLYSNNYR